MAMLAGTATIPEIGCGPRREKLQPAWQGKGVSVAGPSVT